MREYLVRIIKKNEFINNGNWLCFNDYKQALKQYKIYEKHILNYDGYDEVRLEKCKSKNNGGTILIRSTKRKQYNENL